MDKNWISSQILAAPKLHAIWAKVEEPLLLYFLNTKVPYSLQAHSDLRAWYDAFGTRNKPWVICFEIEDIDAEEMMMGEFHVTSYPTLILYDYGREQKRLSDLPEFQASRLSEFVKG